MGYSVRAVPDNWNFNASNPVWYVGGNYNQNLNYGMFYVNRNSVSNTNGNIGCRTIVIAIPYFNAQGAAHLLVKIRRTRRELVHPSGRWKTREATMRGEYTLKRTGHLYEMMISDENLFKAIVGVNAGHRWHKGHKPNRTVMWVESHIPEAITALREILENGFEPKPVKVSRRFDRSAGKWRDICEPALWPDQYIHHALIQVLQPAMMRGMDNFCCGSIKGRGIHYGMKAIKKWMKNDPKGTKWCMEMDIRLFYNSLMPAVVMARLRQIVKDRKAFRVAEKVMMQGILAGLYPSQWFANTTLQPLDRLIRENGATHYLRYMDNFTIFSSNKRTLKKIFCVAESWLKERGLSIKDNWQIFPTASRAVRGLGYRFFRGYTLLRKRNLLRLKRQLRVLYRRKKACPLLAAGLISRLGQLKHCNSTAIYRKIVKGRVVRYLKNIVREHTRRELEKWSLYSAGPVALRP